MWFQGRTWATVWGSWWENTLQRLSNHYVAVIIATDRFFYPKLPSITFSSSSLPQRFVLLQLLECTNNSLPILLFSICVWFLVLKRCSIPIPTWWSNPISLLAQRRYIHLTCRFSSSNSTILQFSSWTNRQRFMRRSCLTQLRVSAPTTRNFRESLFSELKWVAPTSLWESCNICL